ncbi:CobW-like GTP-binding protein [Pseudomonas sp.]|uniref:CobW family GTP-binding protein n=1 Tax=Pseudomonas sp. TaxID=306 RepID=UPI0028AE671E|nr:CobW-like GTP-binding protein [Pseudomonas sp.]
MLQNIPTHIIAGPLGAGKTSVLRSLLGQRPAGERWAVLINEFGQVGLDAALLTRDEAGLEIAEVAGGCLCCVNGVPFQVGLGRLLRRIKPHRVFIEPSGLGHPLQLLKQLRQTPWQGVLDVQPMVVVLDAQRLAGGKALPEVHQQALAGAGLVVINKAACVDSAKRLLINAELPEIERLWTNQGELFFHRLPKGEPEDPAGPVAVTGPVDISSAVGTLWTDIGQPVCQVAEGEGGWSIGWRWHPSQRFACDVLIDWLAGWPWKRAKGVIHSVGGWQSFNALAPAAAYWSSSEWRTDTRIELIFEQAQDAQALSQTLAACRLHG